MYGDARFFAIHPLKPAFPRFPKSIKARAAGIHHIFLRKPSRAGQTAGQLESPAWAGPEMEFGLPSLNAPQDLPSAQAANRGARRKRNSADLARIGESVVREFLKSKADGPAVCKLLGTQWQWD